ncbi:MAG: 50S ribosomal protein L11 [Microgenomates group bacterium GW2011_GWA1_48_10]|nr:MAG: 50S ribosomal protein L11 [Microgenomates group bacterium GW2011_GWA1_48_10]
MAKKIKTVIKINLPAGEATPAPPVGTALGPQGIPIMDFVRAYNDKTKDQKGQVIPAVITIFEDRTFAFITKLPPVSELIKKELALTKGSGKAGRETAGTLKKDQVKKIAEMKMPDLNANGDVEASSKIVAGTARSMGVKIE